MLRDIIEIDEALCNGCGDCVPECHEGALQIIDNKARLISDLMCDGLGACLGKCPTGAMKVIQREAAPYDERQVMENIIKGGINVIKAHLEHLIEHNELENYGIAVELLNEQKIALPELNINKKTSRCPGNTQQINEKIDPIMDQASDPVTDLNSAKNLPTNNMSGELTHWPIQLHLINPTRPDFNHVDLLLASDCSAFAAGDFHARYLKGKKLLIACPKLDTNQESYIEKLTILIRYGKLKSITILRMDVPCCAGLQKLVQTAHQQTRKSLPIHTITLNKYGQEV